MKVSVIIPVHNEQMYIESCIKSVLNQTYEDLEIIVVDDHSTDNSIDIVRNITDDRIKILKSKSYGVSYARNKGIRNSTGTFIAFLDSDDLWYEDKIKKQVEFMNLNNIAFSFTNYNFVDKNNNFIRRTYVPSIINYNDALKNTCIFTSSVMFNMKYISKKDIYMPNIPSEDSATWWNVLKKGYSAYGMDGVYVNYRIKGKSLSSNKFVAVKRTYNLYKYFKIPFIRRFYYLVCYIINAIKRRYILK